MDRKNFIASASLLAGGAMITPAFASVNAPVAQPVGSTLKLKKGVSFYMIKEELPLVDKCKLVRGIGFDGVEFNSPVDFSLDELLHAKEQSGIEIPSLVNKDHWSKPLSDPDPEVRQFTIDSVAKSLEDAKALGADTVLVVPGVVNEKVPYGVAYRNAIDSVRKLIPHAERTGVKVGLENVWNNFILSPVEARHFVDEINHPLVGWYFDIGNILRYGWPEHWIAELNRRIVKLHAKEFSRAKMNDEGLRKGFGVELLEGDNNWQVVMQALRDIDHQGGWLTVELGEGDRDYLQRVSKQVDAILGL